MGKAAKSIFAISQTSSHLGKFKKIFDEHSKQEQVFEIIAKPIIERVLNGYNGTIFAYGQTGSGKTYTITGSSEDFEERGVIPRCIEEIFAFVKGNPYKYTIYISYLEIYNEVGYDLLNSKRQFSTAKDLPESCQKEPNKEKVKIHNIKTVRVCSEEEAMMLLLVGDSNRITVETSRNLNSSRSHCIFTINIISNFFENGPILNSKLNLIDLAGSERIYKSNISGLTLKEAKSINLSLHYLQDVVRILCLKKAYVPFRNSLLTYVLKDSLCGNCSTVLIATLDLDKENFEETISTCKFSHNVGQVFIETKINKTSSSKEEIAYLKNIIEDLQSELSSIATVKQIGSLSKKDIERCKVLIKDYLKHPKDELQIRNLNMREIRYCFKYFKQLIKEQENDKVKVQKQNEKHITSVKEFKNVVKHQQKQIDQLYNEISMKIRSELKPSSPITVVNTDNHNTSSKSLLNCLNTSENKIDFNYYIDSIEKIVQQAKHFTLIVEQCQKNISTAKENLQYSINPKNVIEKILTEQNIYKASLLKLENLKFKTKRVKTNLSTGMKEITTNFDICCKNKKDTIHLLMDNNCLQPYNLTEFNNTLFENNEDDKENFIFNDLSQFSCDSSKSKLSCNKKDSYVLKEKNATPLYKKDIKSQDKLDNVLKTENPNFFHNSLEMGQVTHNSIIKNNKNVLLQSNSRMLTLISDECLETSQLQLETLDENISDIHTWQTPERDINVNENKTVRTFNKNNLLKSNDSAEFKEFLSKVAFTGDDIVDEEIVNFYRTKFLYSYTS